MSLIVAGMNHRGASLDVREKVAYRPSETLPVLAELRDRGGASEAVLLSTCNRTEFYLVDSEPCTGDNVAGQAQTFVWSELSARLGGDASVYGYVYRDRAAVEHLFRVASGLDSMILGEAEVQGQVRDAWEGCRACSGAILNRLFQSSLNVAGRVRAETSIGKGAASVSSAAVQLAKQIFGSLIGRRAMILGAGEMAELALECLVGEGVRAAIVSNRTYEHACELADRYGAHAIRYDECWASLGDVDLLLCSTASPAPIVSAAKVRHAVERRPGGGRPLCILDVALPRDVEPAVRAIENVFLYDLDDLHAVVSANIDRRKSELAAASAMIDEEVERYWSWLASLAAIPVVTSFRRRMDEMRERELAAALRHLDRLSPEERSAVEQLSRALMNKFLHEPTVRLRAAAANGRGLSVVDTARYLFGLDTTPDESHATQDPGKQRGGAA